MKNILFRLFLFLLATPLFFACSTSRDFASFSSASSSYHGTKTKARTPPAATEIAAVNQPETTVSDLAEKTAAAAVAAEPSAELTTMESRLNQATAQAKTEAKAAKTTAKAPKLNFAQKLALKKAMKMLNKAKSEQKPGKIQSPNELAKPTLDHNLKLALIFLLVAVIGYIFSWILGTILFIVALVFLILWISTL